MHTRGGWENQFARMLRWYEKVKEARGKLARNGKLSAFDIDDIFAYFQNCYYLREWLLKDRAITQPSLDSLFKTSKPLQICRDICNGTKHLTIDRPSIDKNFSIGREALPWGGDEHYYAYIGGDRHDLFDLVNSCQQEWTDFLALQGLLKPKSH